MQVSLSREELDMLLGRQDMDSARVVRRLAERNTTAPNTCEGQVERDYPALFMLRFTAIHRALCRLTG